MQNERTGSTKEDGMKDETISLSLKQKEGRKTGVSD